MTSSVLGAMAKAGAAKQYAAVAAAPAKRAATDRRVRRESHRAARNAAIAWRRAERVGLSEALNDRRVARRLRRAQRHISRAAAYSFSPAPSHRLRNATLLVAGAGLGAFVAARGVASTRCTDRVEMSAGSQAETSNQREEQETDDPVEHA